MHVFHTYTSYVPPFTRNLAVLVPGRQGAASSASDTQVSNASQRSTNVPPPAGQSARFTRIPPQTSHEVMEEVQTLFQRVLQDTGKGKGESAVDDLFVGQKFKHVKMTVRLVNSYISAHYQHSSLETAEALFWKVFGEVDLVPDARSYLEALERCARSKRGHERSVGLRFAEKVWSEWEALEESRRTSDRPLDARMVERAHIAFMRVLALYAFYVISANASHLLSITGTGSSSLR